MALSAKKPTTSKLDMFNTVEDITELPPWIGDERLHSSHRSNLLRKDEKFYSQFNWTEPHDMPYYWAGFGKQDHLIEDEG